MISALCLDVHAEIFCFLKASEQAKLRRTSKHFCTVFNHAFQRGYVAAAIHEGYVEKLDTMHEDGDDGHPLLRVAPLYLPSVYWKMKRSEKDTEATLFVNVGSVLRSAKTTVLESNFLRLAPFKAVHLYGTETVEKIDDSFLSSARMKTFTMTTPCPKLREICRYCFQSCSNLTDFDISGCFALERVGHHWFSGCTALESARFKGCCRLKRVGSGWFFQCTNLSAVDLRDLVALESVGSNWLRYSSSLKSIDLRECVALHEVGENFLEQSPSVARIFVSKEHKLPPTVEKFHERFVSVLQRAGVTRFGSGA